MDLPEKIHEKSLLIVHAGALGDFVLIWPVLIRLKRAGFRISAILPNRSLRIGLRFGLIDEGLDMESRPALPFFSRIRLPVGIKSDGAVLWVGKDDGLARLIQPSASLPVLFLNPKPAGPVHAAKTHVEAVQHSFPIEPADDLTLGFPNARPVRMSALIHPGSGSSEKQFPPNFYRELAGRLHCFGFKITFLLGPAELDSNLSGNFKGENLIQSYDADFLVDQLNATGLFIGNDSGPSHLAGFMGIPTISMFRSTDPAVWGALGRRVCHLKGNTEPGMAESVMRIVRKWLKE